MQTMDRFNTYYTNECWTIIPGQELWLGWWLHQIFTSHPTARYVRNVGFFEARLSQKWFQFSDDFIETLFWPIYHVHFVYHHAQLTYAQRSAKFGSGVISQIRIILFSLKSDLPH